MRLKGEVVDRLRQVLGGKAPTEKRIVKLLEEVEARRQAGDAEMVEAQRSAQFDAPAGGSPAIHDSLGALREELGGGMGIALEDAPEPLPEEPGPGQPAQNTEMEILRATVKQMQAKIEDLSKPVAVDETNQAIGAGRLPVTTVAAPPLGLTGPAALPRGEWFMTPSFPGAPRIKMWICGCPECKSSLAHYRCIMCHAGPFFYDPRKGRAPGGRKQWFAPGAVWGVNHECCSPMCWMQYSQMFLGPSQGQGMAQPETADVTGEPIRVTMGPGSD